MSINWVMLSSSGTPFTPLDQEQTLYTSPNRVALSISIPTHYPGRQQQAFSCTSSSGQIYLTSRRLIYIPSQRTDKLQSFATPFLNLHDSHVTAPFFGPNIWQALLQPVAGGGIPAPSTGVVELKFTFKEGGAFDFQSKFDQLKERAQHAAELRREEGRPTDAGHLNLEDLPAYQEESDGPLISPVIHNPVENARAPIAESHRNPPVEPPPGYDEIQSSVRQH